MVLCEYGCNKEGKYTLPNGKKCCSSHHNKCTEIRRRNAAGVSQAHKDGRIPSDFGGKSHVLTDKDRKRRNHLPNVFTANATIKTRTRRSLIAKRGAPCEECGLSEWRNKPLNVELHHIDGDRHNCLETNLKLLCPNCHSQTPNFRSLGRPNTGKRVSDQQILDAVKSTKSIRQALLKLGIAAKGANYARVVRVIASVDQLAESSTLRVEQCRFESDQRHNKLE